MGSVLNQDEKGGLRLRSLGIKSFSESVSQPATSGLHILLGLNLVAPTKLTHNCLGEAAPLARRPCEPDSSTGLITESNVVGLYEFAQAAEPGHYFLSIEPVDGAPVNFALAILPQRLTMLVFQHDCRTALARFPV